MDIGFLTRGTRGVLAAGHRNAPALSLEDQQTWTYRELDARTCRFANTLLALGVQGGDRVALLMYNSLDHVAAYLAVTSVGCVAVRINFRLRREELRYVLRDSSSSVLLVDESLLAEVEPIRTSVPVTTYLVFGTADERIPDWALSAAAIDCASPTPPEVPIPVAGEAAALIYTSGTTGAPKGAVWTHGNTMWAAAAQAVQWNYDARTVAMTTGPLYHVGGLEDLILPCLFTRGHAVITRSGSFEIGRTLRVVEHHRVTDAFLFPFMLYEMLERAPADSSDLSSLRRIVSGGSALLPWAVRELAQRLPNTAIALGYGLTEGGAVVTMPEHSIDSDNADAAGTPVPGVEVRICDEDGTEQPAGVDGEVWVRGPAVATAYWNKPEATAQTFADGWCRTGDVGTVTMDGLLKLTGRTKDMIRTGGENIYPIEIEGVIADHPDVLDVAVVGVPDARFQEAICAVVVCRPGADVTADDLVAYVAGRLAGYKKPKHVVFIDTLPRNPSGKVLKHLLRERYEPLGQRSVT